MGPGHGALVGRYGHILEVFKGIIQHGVALTVSLVFSIYMKLHTDQRAAILLCIAYKRIQGIARKTGLSSKTAFVIILGILLDHLVVIIPVALLIHLVGLRTGIIGCSGNLLEGRMLQGRLRDQCHISRTGIMLFVLKSMRIRKMRVDTAKLRCFRIHQIRKATDTAADCFRNTVCNIVCRFQHQSVERPAHA